MGPGALPLVGTRAAGRPGRETRRRLRRTYSPLSLCLGWLGSAPSGDGAEARRRRASASERVSVWVRRHPTHATQPCSVQRAAAAFRAPLLMLYAWRMCLPAQQPLLSPLPQKRAIA